MLGDDLPAARPLTAAGFVEANHPRHPKGSGKGGEFREKTQADPNHPQQWDSDRLKREAPGGDPAVLAELKARGYNPAEVAPKGAAARAIEAGKAARARGASDAEVAEVAYATLYPKQKLAKGEGIARARNLEAKEPLARAWESGTAMGDIEDMTYATESDAELGRMVREYYRKQTAELGDVQKRSPGA